MALKLLSAALALVLGGLCAAPASAVKTLSGGVAAGPFIFRHDATFQSGDTGDIGYMQNACGAWAISHYVGEGGGGIVEVYGSRGTTSAEGVLLATLSTTTAVPTVIRTAYPLIVVRVNTAPASGTARVYLVCSSVAAGGGVTASATSLMQSTFTSGSVGSASLAVGICLGQSAVGNCLTNPGATTALLPIGMGMRVKHLSCLGHGTGAVGPLIMEVIVRRGSVPDTFVSSDDVSIATTDMVTPGIERSASFDLSCPYTEGCGVSARIVSGLSAGATVNVTCTILSELT